MAAQPKPALKVACSIIRLASPDRSQSSWCAIHVSVQEGSFPSIPLPLGIGLSCKLLPIPSDFYERRLHIPFALSRLNPRFPGMVPISLRALPM
jgi:hypothetical protein